MTHYPLIIIGGGPAGLMAAISARENSTLLIEKGSKPGRKLLISAAGQCNFTHWGTIPELLAHYNDRERFLRSSLYAFTNEDVIRFFENRGVPSFFDENGRVLPRSLSARDIQRELILATRERGVVFHQNDGVVAVEKVAHGVPSGLPGTARFRVITKLRNFTCDTLILATGGKSYPKTGSTGEGYRFAQELGHNIIEPKPALTGLEAEDFKLTPLSGLSFEDCAIEIFRKNKLTGRFNDNLLITHKGLSGPVIINNSRQIEKGDEIRINFIGSSKDELGKELERILTEEGKKTVAAFLKQKNIPRKLIPYLAGENEGEKPLSQVRKEEKKQLLNNLTAYTISVSRLQGFDTAMVTAGGVDTKEINPKTMESRLVPGLFFAGEIIDIDGDSGGYNLQAAFSTGYLAGKNTGEVRNEIQ